MAKCDEESIFEDNVMTVRYVPIYNNNNQLIDVENEDQVYTGKKNSQVEAVVEQVPLKYFSNKECL